MTELERLQAEWETAAMELLKAEFVVAEAEVAHDKTSESLELAEDARREARLV